LRGRGVVLLHRFCGGNPSWGALRPHGAWREPWGPLISLEGGCPSHMGAVAGRPPGVDSFAGLSSARCEFEAVMDDLLRELEGSDFQSAAAMDRIESMISTRPELERYTAILTAKVQGDDFQAVTCCSIASGASRERT
jgi:hypothetical protein